MTKQESAEALLDLVNKMEDWRVSNIYEYFLIPGVCDIKSVIKLIDENRMDDRLSYQKKIIYGKLKRSIRTVKRYDITLNEKLIIDGQEIGLEMKRSAVRLMEELHMPRGNIYYKLCIRKLLEDKKEEQNEVHR